MNKSGQTLFVAFMLGVLFFVLGTALAPAMTDTVNSVLTDPLLDCNNSSITDQNKAVCVQVDTMQPLFIGLIFALGGMLIAKSIT